MSRDEHVTCDKCDSVTDDRISIICLTHRIAIREPFSRVDLCSECAAKLKDWIHSRATGNVAP